jgi:hypothetical protein
MSTEQLRREAEAGRELRDCLIFDEKSRLFVCTPQEVDAYDVAVDNYCVKCQNTGKVRDREGCAQPCEECK